MNDHTIFIVGIVAKTIIALGCIGLAFLSIKYGWNLVSKGRDKRGKTDFKGKWADKEISISASSVGGLIIALSVLWGIPIYFIAPKVRIGGNEVALHIQKGSLEQLIVAAKDQDFNSVMNDKIKLREIFGRALVEKNADWRLGELTTSAIDDLGNQPVLSVKMESDRETAYVKYFPVRRNHNVEFKPVEFSVSAKDYPRLSLEFKGSDSIKAGSIREVVGGSDPNRRSVTLQQCGKPASKTLSQEEKNTINNPNGD